MPARLANIPTPCRYASIRVSATNFLPLRQFMFKSVAVTFAALLLLGCASGATGQALHKKTKHKSVPCRAGCKPATSAPTVFTTSADDAGANQQLSDLARSLHNAAPGAYEKLSAFAEKHAADEWGAQAALALGYDDYQKNRAAQALTWLSKAKNDTLLQEYVLFWSAQAKRSLKRNAEALADLNAVHRAYPNTAIREQVLDVLAVTATESGHAQDAIAALNDYSGTASKPTLLLDRAHAYQSAGQTVRAARDYQAIFYKYPLSDEAKGSGTSLLALQKSLRSEFPYATAEMQEQRAQALFEAHKWREAKPEFDKLAGMLHEAANPTRQRAQLRLAQCKIQLKASLTQISSLVTPDADVDAERLFVLSQFQRSAKNDNAMLATIEDLGKKYPQSKWTEEGYMQAGNYYWVALDRAKAVANYQRVLGVNPSGKNAYNAEWRIAWIAYVTRQPNADEKLRTFLLKYPVSANAVDALYWLGRFSERSGNPDHARTFYSKALDRFPETYFGFASADRLAKLGSGEENPAEFLDNIPPAPPIRPFDEPIPPSAADRWARAQALRSIAFDSSAELELKNAFFATGSPRFLIEASQAAFDQGHFAAGMAYARLAIPSFDSRKLNELPLSAWKALYPLPYESSVRRESGKNELDPMIVAGLIRQESTFQADIVSHANAVGLMQLLPKTAKIMAKEKRVKYAKNKLFDPEYNIELGTYYFKGLVNLTGAPEYALAAYNAGEDRIALWKSERSYEEIPELVESIPFSETRDYVQIVLRNAALYRMIYGPTDKPATLAGGGTSVSSRFVSTNPGPRQSR